MKERNSLLERIRPNGSFRQQTANLDFHTNQKIETAFFNTLNPYKSGGVVGERSEQYKRYVNKELDLIDLVSQSSTE